MDGVEYVDDVRPGRLLVHVLYSHCHQHLTHFFFSLLIIATFFTPPRSKQANYLFWVRRPTDQSVKSFYIACTFVVHSS